MSKSLVIVESPTKVKSVSKYLGTEYKVVASVGHIRSLKDVEIDSEFNPIYKQSKDEIQRIEGIRKAAKDCHRIYLAPDPDREGEAIAWHLFELLKDINNEENFYRVTYNQITRDAIISAFNDPKRINMSMVNAQRARQSLDLLVGFKGSQLVRSEIYGAKSVGRVQTPALRMVVETEKIIQNFKPETYFVIGVDACKDERKNELIQLKLSKINEKEFVNNKTQKLFPETIKTKEQLDNSIAELKNNDLKIRNIKQSLSSQNPPEPFRTRTLMTEASTWLNLDSDRTMRIAQKLYEKQLITYMRTDSTSVDANTQDECRKLIKKTYGEEYISNKSVKQTNVQGAQLGHEAIRPTIIQNIPASVLLVDNEKVELTDDEQKLYKLIWGRLIASLMTSAKIEKKVLEVVGGEKEQFLFTASSEKIIFLGRRKVYPSKKLSDDFSFDLDLKKDDILDPIKWHTKEKHTRPGKKRYTEASLIKELEDNGLGRPSTYASIMSKLMEREYVLKKQRSLIPTELGINLVDLIVKTEDKLSSKKYQSNIKESNSSNLFDINFTANMEAKLDEIEHGKIEWISMIKNFYPSLEMWLKNARQTADTEKVNEQLKALDYVKEWDKPYKFKNKVRDDNKTIDDFKDQIKSGKLLSEKQGKYLYDLCCRYYDQIPKDLIDKLEIHKPAAVRDDTARKLSLFDNITFNEPNKVGKRVYDDSKFVNSLSDQVALGKRLSEKQIAFLDKLILKYGDQLDDLASIKSELGLDVISSPDVDETIAPLLEIMENISTWAEPVKRGKMEFNDKSFFDSLSTQFKNNGSLSDRQIGALKKMVARYADQIPNYHEKKDSLGLLEPRKPKENKEVKEA